MTVTSDDAIKAAASVARDVAEGRLSPDELGQAVEDECRGLFGTVVGEDDQLFALQCGVARGVLAAGGVPADELSEWLAVARRRAGALPEPLGPYTDPAEVGSSASGPLSPDSDAPEIGAQLDAQT